MLGADLGGYVAGTQARQDYELKNSANARAEEELGINKQELGIKKDYLNIAQQDLGIRLDDQSMKREEFGWKKKDRYKQEAIDKGMIEASQAGGYTGVVQYLSQVDPEKAIQFHANKLALDDKIMQNDVMKSVVQNKKMDAMFESYGVIGKMGAALLNAPETQRADMYQQILPMVKKVVPDAPDTLNGQAIGMFMLGAAQSMDANQIASTALGVDKATDAIGKNVAAMKSLEQQGKTNSPEYQARSAELAKQQQVNDSLQLQNTNAKLSALSKDANIQNKQLAATLTVKNDLAKTSKSYTDFMGSYQQIKPLLDIIDTKPNDANARIQLRQYVARQTEKGVMTNQDIERMSSAAGYAKMSKNIVGYMTGQSQVLNDQEIVQIKDMMNAFAKEQYNNQILKEQKYGEMIGSKFDGLLNYKDIPKPSQMYVDTIAPSNAKPQPTADDIKEGLSSPAAMQEFQSFFGQDPRAIMQQNQQSQAQGQQGQPTGQPQSNQPSPNGTQMQLQQRLKNSVPAGHTPMVAGVPG